MSLTSWIGPMATPLMFVALLAPSVALAQEPADDALGLPIEPAEGWEVVQPREEGEEDGAERVAPKGFDRDRAVRLRIREDMSPGAILAETKLRSGRYVMAMRTAAQCVKNHPDALDCLAVLLRAKAALGRCEAVVEDFDRVRQSSWWDDGVAAAEGVCRLRLGEIHEALEAYNEAVGFKEHLGMQRYQRSMAALRVGAVDLLEADLSDLPDLDDGEWLAPLLEVTRAYVLGAPEVDGLLAQLRAAPELEDRRLAQIQLAWLDCWRWLDLGMPMEAYRAGEIAFRMAQGNPRLLSCRAEALRRGGDRSGALGALERRSQANADAVATDAIYVRALLDAGRFEEAEEALAGLPRNDDPEVVASRWYHAVATGDEVEAAFWRAVHARLLVPPDHTLASLMPERTPAWQGGDDSEE